MPAMSYPKYTKSLLTLRKSKKNHYPELFVSTETVAWIKFRKILRKTSLRLRHRCFPVNFAKFLRTPNLDPARLFAIKEEGEKDFLKLLWGRG